MDSATPTSRRTVLQQMIRWSSMAGIFPLTAWAATSPKEGNSSGIRQHEPFYLPPPADPLQPGPLGIGVRTLIHSHQTGGQFSCVENYIAARQMGPAPHVHEKLDELMYVQEGTVSWMVGDQVYEVVAGGWIFRPHGIVHTFWNATQAPALAIDMFFQQNLEDYLDELFHQIFPDMLKRHLTPADPAIAARIAALSKAYGITLFLEKRQAIIEQYGLHP